MHLKVVIGSLVYNWCFLNVSTCVWWPTGRDFKNLLKSCLSCITSSALKKLG
uniref:Uncharacterized protein n=1 Tax=Anguilla anguilla TaxID=7936 RepID=A0A0E9RBA4_ANGAN